jgi:hypothetical protein
MKLPYISEFSSSVLKKTNYKIFVVSMLLFSTLATVNVIEIAFAVNNLTSSYTINGSNSNAGSIQCIRAPCGLPSTGSSTGDSSIDDNKDSSSSLSSTISSPQLSTTITDDDNNNTK